jgi:hypothetical protein
MTETIRLSVAEDKIKLVIYLKPVLRQEIFNAFWNMVDPHMLREKEEENLSGELIPEAL